MDIGSVEDNDAKDTILDTPSRTSLTALCTLNVSPLADQVNGVEKEHNVTAPEDDTVDVSMTEAEHEERGDVSAEVKENDQDLQGEGEEDGEDAEDEDEEEDGDEDDDEDEEEDGDDDDDEDDDEGTASESGTFQSVSEMDGVEGDHSKRAHSPAQGEEAAEEGLTTISKDSNNGVNGNTAVSGPSGQASPILKKVEAPKRKRPKRRSPSLDVALPTGPPARPTIRMNLTIAHDDEEAYLTNVPEHIYEILKKKNHAWAAWYSATLPESQDLDTNDGGAGPSRNGGPDLSGLGGLAKLLEKYPDNSNGKKKRKMDEYDIGQYDVRDPFVDDSELGMDEPTHSAKPTSDGFFVTQGEVELQKAIAAAKDMKASLQSYQASSGKRLPIPVGFGQIIDGGGGAGALSMKMGLQPDSVTLVNTLLSQRSIELGLISPAPDGDESRLSYFETNTPVKTTATNVEGTAQSPIPVDDDEDGHTSTAPSLAPVSKYPTRRVSARLERELDRLRQKVAKESWLKKAKFPPDLREPLMQASQVAVALNEYNENYFNWLPQIFPYNRLTLHKYVKRQFMDDHSEMMRQLQEVNLTALGKQVEQALPMLKEEYEEAKKLWSSTEGAANDGTSHAAAEQEQPLTDDQVLGLQDIDADEGDKAEEDATNKGEPVKRWRWSEPMREILFTIVTIDNAILELRTEKINLENSSEKASMTNARKAIYKRVFELWPEPGWTTTTNISREYALYKKKVDRYTLQYHDSQGKDINSAILL